jgi:hypothetical protein
MRPLVLASLSLAAVIGCSATDQSSLFTTTAPGGSGSGGSATGGAGSNLVAWLNYIGTIYTYDLNQKNGCKPSGITLPAGFQQVGMGFSTDVAGGTSETLYLHPGRGLRHRRRRRLHVRAAHASAVTAGRLPDGQPGQDGRVVFKSHRYL